MLLGPLEVLSPVHSVERRFSPSYMAGIASHSKGSSDSVFRDAILREWTRRKMEKAH
jgi:hypothetical protein